MEKGAPSGGESDRSVGLIGLDWDVSVEAQSSAEVVRTNPGGGETFRPDDEDASGTEGSRTGEDEPEPDPLLKSKLCEATTSSNMRGVVTGVAELEDRCGGNEWKRVVRGVGDVEPGGRSASTLGGE